LAGDSNAEDIDNVVGELVRVVAHVLVVGEDALEFLTAEAVEEVETVGG